MLLRHGAALLNRLYNSILPVFLVHVILASVLAIHCAFHLLVRFFPIRNSFTLSGMEEQLQTRCYKGGSKLEKRIGGVQNRRDGSVCSISRLLYSVDGSGRQ